MLTKRLQNCATTKSAGLNDLQKWCVYHIFDKEIEFPKFKYFICICPESEGFFYISSNPTHARKAREFEVQCEPCELHFATRKSYINTSKIKYFLDDSVFESKESQSSNKFEREKLSPSLIKRIKALVGANPSLEDDVKELIVKDNE